MPLDLLGEKVRDNIYSFDAIYSLIEYLDTKSNNSIKCYLRNSLRLSLYTKNSSILQHLRYNVSLKVKSKVL